MRYFLRTPHMSATHGTKRATNINKSDNTNMKDSDANKATGGPTCNTGMIKIEGAHAYENDAATHHGKNEPPDHP